MSLLLAVVMQAGISGAANLKSSMEVLPVTDGVSLFKQLCFDPFPDPKASLAAITDPALQFQKMIETPSEAEQPGESWFSQRAKVSYADADWLPRDLPSPQCVVRVSIPNDTVPSDAANSFATALGIPTTKIANSARGGRGQWDLPGKGSDKWRLFFTIQPTINETEMQMVIMNIRGKVK